MNASQNHLEWFKKAYENYAGDLTDVKDWQYLQRSAVYRKHIGDIDGAIESLVKAISLAR